VRQASFQLANRDFAENVRPKHERVCLPVERGQQVSGGEFASLYDRPHTRRRPNRRRDEFQPSSVSSGLPRAVAI